MAGYFDVNIRTIHELSRKGYIPAPIKIGGQWRWREADVEKFLLTKTEKGSQNESQSKREL